MGGEDERMERFIENVKKQYSDYVEETHNFI